MIYIIAAILIFGVLIAVHELGHFLAAKACGVRVNEFAIGMGPALLKKTKGDTQYSLRLLPIGGFCAMEGEEEDSSDPAALNNQGFWQKLLIFAAGALMNFLAGLIIILVLYAGVKAVNVPVIRGFAEGCPLESASGLREGDRILSIDGERIYTFSDVSLLLGRNKTGDFDLVIRRDGQKLRLENFHMERGEYLDQSGEKFTGFGLYFGAEELTFGGRLQYCWNQAVDFVRLVRLSLQMLITGEAGFSDMSGPVGIVSTITTVGEQSESAAAAAANIAYLAALIAVNLAVMNLLPLPALDGGKIFFAFISNDFVFLTEFGYDVNYFSNGDYDKETFKLNDFPFVFHTVGAARKLLADGGINILHEVASDGASELLAARINEMSDEDYTQYLRYHFYICEKPELLGMTNHLLFMGEKK